MATRSRSAFSTAVIDGPVTCVEYGLTMRSARFTLAGTSMPRTALIVVVPEAEPAVVPGFAAPGVPAHITVLYPFADCADVDEPAIAEVFAPFSAFDFELSSLEQFDDGLVWLRPDPSDPFEAL